MAMGATAASADDIDIYKSGLLNRDKPNILFVLDYSTSMLDDLQGNDPATSGLPARIDVLRTAIEDLIDKNLLSIKAGVSAFSEASFGVNWPIVHLDEDASGVDPDIPVGVHTNASLIKDLVNDFDPFWGTATVSALLEAAAYFAGGEVTLGGSKIEDIEKFRPAVWDNAAGQYSGYNTPIGTRMSPNKHTYMPTGAFVADTGSTRTAQCQNYSVPPTWGMNYCEGKATTSCSLVSATAEVDEHSLCNYQTNARWDGANYISPVTQSCQKNFVVLISDGDPSVSWRNRDLRGFIGMNRNQCEDLSTSIFGNGTNIHGNCGPELTAVMRNNDLNPLVPNSFVTTYTIGFGTSGNGDAYLTRLATDGGGEFYPAQDSDSLTEALDNILNAIVDSSESFTGASVDTDRAQGITGNRVFFPLFQPSRRSVWQGNVKGYFLGPQGLQDVDGNPALDTSSDAIEFAEDTRSFWSGAADGPMVLEGGFQSKLATQSRNILTFTGDSASIPDWGVNLNDASGVHRVESTNTALTNAMFGAAIDTATKDALIDWLHNSPMRDPLHAPVVKINYESQEVLYVATNQGLLHAIDATDPQTPGNYGGGQELFAFIPPELLPTLSAQMENSSTADHIYGLDGPITPWHDDENQDGVVNDNDTVMLIIGMRRGGKNYYALDVTNPDAPTFKWVIRGGVDDQFMDLAQTWSKPLLLRVRRLDAPETAITKEHTERVLMFAGGYDAATLDDTNAAAPSAGGSLYIVDRYGNPYWKKTDVLTHSIPSDIRAIDSDNDGLADRAYFADVGGKLWRLDFDDVTVSAQFHLNPLADLSTLEGRSYQPFFYPPSVSVSGPGPNPHYKIAIGSGNRDMPLDSPNLHQVFVLKDYDIEKGVPAAGINEISAVDLFDSTPYDLGSDDSEVVNAAKDALRAAPGWRLELNPGEMVLSSTASFQESLLMTTYQPTEAVPDEEACTVTTALNRYYALDLRNGNPVQYLSGDSSGGLSSSDRSKVVSTSGISSSPLLIFQASTDEVNVLVDKAIVDSMNSKLYTQFWYNR